MYITINLRVHVLFARKKARTASQERSQEPTQPEVDQNTPTTAEQSPMTDTTPVQTQTPVEPTIPATPATPATPPTSSAYPNYPTERPNYRERYNDYPDEDEFEDDDEGNENNNNMDETVDGFGKSNPEKKAAKKQAKEEKKAAKKEEMELDRIVRKFEADMIKTMGSYGLTVNQLTPAQEQIWYDDAEKAMPNMMGTFSDRNLFTRIQNILREHRAGRR